MLAKNIPVVVGGAEVPQTTKESASTTAVSDYLALTRVDRSMKLQITKVLKPLNLSPMQWLLLGVIKLGSEDGLTHESLAATLGVKASQITSLVGHLSNNRMIRQRVSRNDRRNQQVRLSAKGSTILDDAEVAVSAALSSFWKTIPDNHLTFYKRVVLALSSAKN